MKNKNAKLKDMAETARQRSNIYGLLATIYHKEPTKELLRQIKEPTFLDVLSEQGIQLGDDFLQRDEDELINDLAVEYTRLFLGPGKHISPHESVHHERGDGDWGRFWGKDTVLVKKFIETAGLEYKSEFTGMPDHISVELEFMQKLTEREAQAWEENDDNGALYCLKIEEKFIREHLIKWVPIFCDKVIKETTLSFYKEMAKLTKSFIEFEKTGLQER
ncbi:MAG: molecular chaperone TorD family protein [Nitrospirae bacterium]|nr:molecular chaperone TorD family protein [Nitrospirota bacterium]